MPTLCSSLSSTAIPSSNRKSSLRGRALSAAVSWGRELRNPLLVQSIVWPAGLESRSTARNTTPRVAPSAAAWSRLQSMLKLSTFHSWRAVWRISREAGRGSRSGARPWRTRRRKRRIGWAKQKRGRGWNFNHLDHLYTVFLPALRRRCRPNRRTQPAVGPDVGLEINWQQAWPKPLPLEMPRR